MTQAHSITMLGTGLIGDFYTMTLHGQRGRDRVQVVYSRSPSAGRRSRSAGACPHATTEHRGGGRPPGHRHRRRRPAQPHARGGGRRRRRRRQGRAVHQAAGPHGRGGRRDARRRRGGRASSAATSRTWCTRPRRSRRWPRSPPGRSATSCGCAAARPTRARTAPGSGTPSRPAAACIVDLGCHCIEIIRSLRRQGQPAGRGDVLERHARAPDRGRGQRHRPHPLRERGDRPVRGELDVPRRHGPARRGGRHRRHDLDSTTSCAPGFEMFTRGAAAATSPRRPRRRAAGCSRSATRSRELGYVDMFTDMFDAMEAGPRSPSRRSTTATSSTP